MMPNFTNELWVVYALVFGAALLGIQGVYWFLFKNRREQKAINRRVALSCPKIRSNRSIGSLTT